MRTLAPVLMLLAAAPAMAQEAVDTGSANAPMAQSYASMLPLVMIFVIFYFLLIRPQQKRFKQHQVVLSNLKKGDMVVTGGGKIGKITKVADDVVTVELAPGVEVKVLKSTISGLHGVPVASAKAATKKKNPAVKNDNIVPSKEDVANDN